MGPYNSFTSFCLIFNTKFRIDDLIELSHRSIAQIDGFGLFDDRLIYLTNDLMLRIGRFDLISRRSILQIGGLYLLDHRPIR
jgi:hypothetical protein